MAKALLCRVEKVTANIMSLYRFKLSRTGLQDHKYEHHKAVNSGGFDDFIPRLPLMGAGPRSIQHRIQASALSALRRRPRLNIVPYASGGREGLAHQVSLSIVAARIVGL